MMFRKKGISPLIATVLIIGFTVALAAIIMTWGTTFSKGMQKASEEQANIEMICSNNQQVNFLIDAACYVEDTALDTIKITIDNRGTKSLKNMTLRLFTSPTDVLSGVSLGGMEAFGYEVVSVNIDQSTLDGKADLINSLEIIPIIEISGQEVTCSQTIAAYGDVLGEGLNKC